MAPSSSTAAEERAPRGAARSAAMKDPSAEADAALNGTLAYWRRQLASRDVDPDITWTDGEVMEAIGLIVAEVDSRPATPEPSAEADAAWEALLSDPHVNVESAAVIVAHRPAIEAAIRPSLDVERLREAVADLHRWEWRGDWTSLNDIIARIDAALAPEPTDD